MYKGKTILRKALKAVLWTAAIVVLLFLLIAGLIQLPSIQNRIVKYATSFVSKKTHTRVEIENISILFPKSIVIKGLFLDDLQKDTLLYAGKVKINIALYDLLSSKIAISSFGLEDLNVNLNNTATDSLFNYNFLLTAFQDTVDQSNAKSDSASKWTFQIDKIRLKNIRLRYNDVFSGMDVSAALTDLKLDTDEIDFAKSIYSIDELQVEKLDAKVLINKSSTVSDEKSGGVLPKISAKRIRINNSTVIYSDATIKQSVNAAISKLELKDGYIDLQSEQVSLDKLFLSKSEIQYNTYDTTLYTETPKVEAVATTGSNWKVVAKRILLDDNSLSYQVNNKPVLKNEFDANHLQYRHIILEASDLTYAPDRTEVVVKKFSASDQNNFSITRFETAFSMDPQSITAKDLRAETSNSSIDADLKIQFTSLDALKDSLPYLMLDLDLKEVKVQNADVLYFNPQLIKQAFFKNKTNITAVSGKINGKVNNLKGTDIVIKTGTKTLITTHFNILGLPDAETAYFSFPNLKIQSGRRDLVMMAGPAIPANIGLPENLKIQLAFRGTLKSFESTIGVGSSFGSANIFAKIDQYENFRSKVSFTDFDLGHMLKDTAMFGPVSLTLEASGHGLDKNTVTAQIDADVSKIYLNKYTYHNLLVDGAIRGQEFEGKVNLNDVNANLEFDGLVNMNPDQEQFKFRLNVKGADLQKLNLTKEDIRIGFVAAADLKGGEVKKLNGKAGISSMVIAKGDNVYTLDSLLFASINENRNSKIDISSALIGIKYSGTISPADISAELTNFINNYFSFSDTVPINKNNEPTDFTFEIQLHNHPILSQVLLPQLKEFEPGTITGSFDSEKNNLKLNATMNKIVYGTSEIRDLELDVNSDKTALNYKLSAGSISNAQIRLDNFLFDGKLSENTLFANLSSIGEDLNKKLVMHAQITRDKANYKFVLDPEAFYLMNNQWDVADDNYIMFGKEGLLIHHFFIENAGSQINIASVHNKFNDDLNIEIKDFKLDDISGIIEKDTGLVKGNVNANVLLKRVNNSYGIIADAGIHDLLVQHVPIGDLTVKANNPIAERFDLKVNLSGSENNLAMNGYYIPEGGANSISIAVDIQSLSMKTIEAFSMGQITEAAGKLTGNISLQGSTDKPEITGELVFNDAFVKPAVLNNRLELKHETIRLKNDGIYFKSFTLMDASKNSATIDGTVKMEQFENFIFDLQVNTKDFLLFNTTIADNKEFFGRMIIDSRIDVNGPMTLPVVDAKIKIKKGSNFTFAVPENKLTTDKGEDVVEFEYTLKDNSIIYRTEDKKAAKTSFTGFDLSSVIEIDREATLRLLIDPASSDSLVVRGEAALSFTMDRSGKMSLTGAYNLDEGSYLVSLQSVIKRKFDINPGSTIIWNGDPLDAAISINATYSIRASPIDLVADQVSELSEADRSAYKQKYPFWVLLNLRGEILHPEIGFGIELPPENKGILGGTVNAKLNLLNEDPSALNKQVFALLVLGRFIQENPLETDASGGASTMVRSTVGKFLSAQLNQLSSDLVPGVELNFDIQSYDDYSSGQAEGRTQVEIGLKKQLFNERLSVQVGGTVDVEGEKAKKNTANDITSDVTIEYKLVEDGRYRLKGFRNYEYEGAIEGQVVETGLGVSYVRDFNKWKELFRKPKKAKVIQPENQE